MYLEQCRVQRNLRHPENTKDRLIKQRLFNLTTSFTDGSTLTFPNLSKVSKYSISMPDKEAILYRASNRPWTGVLCLIGQPRVALDKSPLALF